MHANILRPDDVDQSRPADLEMRVNIIHLVFAGGPVLPPPALTRAVNRPRAADLQAGDAIGIDQRRRPFHFQPGNAGGDPRIIVGVLGPFENRALVQVKAHALFEGNGTGDERALGHNHHPAPCGGTAVNGLLNRRCVERLAIADSSMSGDDKCPG